MRVVILGGGGFIGSRLAQALVTHGGLSQGTLKQLTLVDTGFPRKVVQDERVRQVEADFSDEQTLRELVAAKPDLIIHLAAIVSGEAEKNFELGMKVNFHASLRLLDLCRTMNHRARIVFSSSCGVFGGDVSRVVTDDTAPKPRSSYGTQKAMVELLINDYSRRGFVDGRTLRLPTIAVRPGKANAATSSFLSAIIREPLNGLRATYPVSPDSKFWLLSPRRVVSNIIHAANIEESLLGDDRIINLPGLTASVQELIEGLEKVAGREVTKLVEYEPDDFLQRIVTTWPPHFETPRADALGFIADGSVDDIIAAYIEEEAIRVKS